MGAIAVRYLEPEQIRASRPLGSAHIRVEILEERTILNAQIKRVFPLSEPLQYLSIQDGAGKEVGVLRRVEGLDQTTRDLFSEQLDRRYFTPRIQRIQTLRQEAGMWRFEVETQRGPAEFFVRNWRDSAHEFGLNRWLIHSVDGGRFEIEDLNALDETSRRLLDQIL